MFLNKYFQWISINSKFSVPQLLTYGKNNITHKPVRGGGWWRHRQLIGVTWQAFLISVAGRAFPSRKQTYIYVYQH